VHELHLGSRRRDWDQSIFARCRPGYKIVECAFLVDREEDNDLFSAYNEMIEDESRTRLPAASVSSYLTHTQIRSCMKK